MHQISTYVYVDDALLSMDVPTGRFPNPYHDFPYLIIEGVLSEAECREITAQANGDNGFVDASLRGNSVDQTIRKTHIHKLSATHNALYQERFEAHKATIERFFSLSLTASTDVQVLGYPVGSFYVAHADDSSELRNLAGETVGFRPMAPERKLSTVLFATSYTPDTKDGGFSGGELCFNYLADEQGKPITLRPRAGDMVVFLSNPYFTHEVLKVEAGYRLTLVQWHDALL